MGTNIRPSIEEGPTSLIDSIKELRNYRQIYQKTITTSWYYKYLSFYIAPDNWANTPFYESGPQEFKERVTYQWEDFLSAEEVSKQNQAEIAKYGAPEDAKIIAKSTTLPNNNPNIQNQVDKQLKTTTIIITDSIYYKDVALLTPKEQAIILQYGTPEDQMKLTLRMMYDSIIPNVTKGVNFIVDKSSNKLNLFIKKAKSFFSKGTVNVEKNILGLDASKTMTATELRNYAKSQGWTKIQSANGPEKWVDENGVARITIKGGSDRAPGSADPHVEIKDASGQRIDPMGNPVTRKSEGNHTPIELK